MNDVSSMNSLIGYLEPTRNKFYLNLSGANSDKDLPEEKIFPFAEIADALPLARIIHARVLSDAGSTLKRLFLFMQRDVYALRDNALYPFNNMDVRNVWQQSFDFYTDTKRNDPSFVLLSSQHGKKGEMLPFLSLFYCRQRKIFFHPPCPVCGQVLQQCEDDELLKRSGLHPFSTSLKRYLYCPACGTPEFHVFERDRNDPPQVKDRRTLIKNFAGLNKAEETTAFPCVDCPLHEKCYGRDYYAEERIVPFAFYPFYMLAFEAAALCATDFIALISGADFRDVQLSKESNRETARGAAKTTVGRVCTESSPFLFDHDERHFLEILYLKLAFLDQVIRSYQTEGRFSHPDMKPGMDQIWVNFPENSGLLPYFWNFKVRILGIGQEETTPVFTKMTSESSTLLGLIWFYTLLTNKRQGMSAVLNCMKKYNPEESGAFEKIIRETVCDSSNVFWDSQGKMVHAGWMSLWEEALRLGWTLVKATFQTDEAAGEKFLEQLECLRREIKENLFLKEISYAASVSRSAETAAVETVLPRTEDEIIHDILKGMIHKLQSAVPEGLKAPEVVKAMMPEKMAPASAQPAADDIEEPVTETVIFSVRSSTKTDAVSSTSQTQLLARERSSREVPLESQETVIISLNDLEPKPKAKAPKADNLEETLIISAPVSARESIIPPTEKPQKTTPPAPSREVPIEAQETLILSLGELEKQTQTKTEKAALLLEETLIMSAFPKPAATEAEKTPSEPRPKKASHEDLLEETVILKPGEKSRDGAKK